MPPTTIACAFLPDRDHTRLVTLKIVFDCGLTVSGTIDRATYKSLLRDPEDLTKRCSREVTPLTNVVAVLPAARISSLEIR